MSSKKKLVPKTGTLANPAVPVAATNPDAADKTYEADGRNVTDQDGNEEHARRQGAVGARRISSDRPRHASRQARR